MEERFFEREVLQKKSEFPDKRFTNYLRINREQFMCITQSAVINGFKDATPRNIPEVNKNWHCQRVTRQTPSNPCDRTPSTC